MEVNLKKAAMAFNGVETYTEIKVRKSDDGLRYYKVPKRCLTKAIELFDQFKIAYDIQSLDDEHIEGFLEEKPLISSIYEEEMCAIYSDLQPSELCKLVVYVNAHKDEWIFLCYFKNSELPEYKELLTKEARDNMDEWMAVALEEYMKKLLDMGATERIDAIHSFYHRGSFKKFLGHYTDKVQEFMYANMTKRMKAEIEELG